MGRKLNQMTDSRCIWRDAGSITLKYGVTIFPSEDDIRCSGGKAPTKSAQFYRTTSFLRRSHPSCDLSQRKSAKLIAGYRRIAEKRALTLCKTVGFGGNSRSFEARGGRLVTMNGSTLSLFIVTLLSLELIVQLGFVTAQRSEEEQELGSDGMCKDRS